MKLSWGGNMFGNEFKVKCVYVFIVYIIGFNVIDELISYYYFVY